MTKSADHSDLPTALKRAESALIRHDRKIVRAQILHRGLILSTIAGAIIFSASALAAMFGVGNGVMTYTHEGPRAHGHAWPTAHLPSWTIAKAGLGGTLGGMMVMFGFAAGANAQARRIGAAGEKRYQLYLAHEELRAAFNAQAERPKTAQYVPSDMRIQQPMILSVKKVIFKSAATPS